MHIILLFICIGELFIFRIYRLRFDSNAAISATLQMPFYHTIIRFFMKNRVAELQTVSLSKSHKYTYF